MKERATQVVFVTVVFSVLAPPGNCSDGEIRLEGGTVGEISTSGNIQVCYTGLWGTVCDTNEDWDEAECAVSGHEMKLAEPDLLLENLEGEGGSMQPVVVGEVKKGEGRGKRR